MRYKSPMIRLIPPAWALRAGAWVCVALIAVLSLLPHEMEARTGLAGWIEHVIAYAGTAGLFRLAYPSWAGWQIVTGLFVYAALLEVLQGFVPGRSPGLVEAIVGGVGAVLGAIGAALIGSRMKISGE